MDRSIESSDQQGYSEILARENTVANGVIEKLRRRKVAVGTFNIIGQHICDAIVWADAIDVYVSSYGSIQHKKGWFANKPGIIHTNHKLLETPARYVWAAVENAIPPQYVSSACITDGGPQTQGADCL